MATNKKTPISFAAIDGEDCGPDVGESSLLRLPECRAPVLCRDDRERCPAKVALEAAIRVYRHHHPEATTHLSRETVEVGVYSGTKH